MHTLSHLDQLEAEAIYIFREVAAEAQNPNLWVSGARPALLWICAVGYGWHYIAYPALFFLGSVFQITGMPQRSGIDGGLFELAIALLGLGGLRTYEKIKGVARQ